MISENTFYAGARWRAAGAPAALKQGEQRVQVFGGLPAGGGTTITLPSTAGLRPGGPYFSLLNKSGSTLSIGGVSVPNNQGSSVWLRANLTWYVTPARAFNTGRSYAAFSARTQPVGYRPPANAPPAPPMTDDSGLICPTIDPGPGGDEDFIQLTPCGAGGEWWVSKQLLEDLGAGVTFYFYINQVCYFAASTDPVSEPIPNRIVDESFIMNIDCTNLLCSCCTCLQAEALSCLDCPLILVGGIFYNVATGGAGTDVSYPIAAPGSACRWFQAFGDGAAPGSTLEVICDSGDDTWRAIWEDGLGACSFTWRSPVRQFVHGAAICPSSEWALTFKSGTQCTVPIFSLGAGGGMP